ncbi:hypothetical protein BHE74_00052372 [Ensete ventricosum]|nr:hypothetical protein BHE74_00052372 [Ensete ventricosum]
MMTTASAWAVTVHAKRHKGDERMEWEMMIQATEIAGGQWQRFRDALKSADLPSDDIDLPGRTFFEFTLDSETVAWGGFETHGTNGLLRSLVVEPAYRSKGVGAEMLRVIEAIAAGQGIARFHLLTTTASGFFERQGYALNQRGSAPSLISQTEQFRGLCPGSACYMCKALPFDNG